MEFVFPVTFYDNAEPARRRTCARSDSGQIAVCELRNSSYEQQRSSASPQCSFQMAATRAQRNFANSVVQASSYAAWRASHSFANSDHMNIFTVMQAQLWFTSSFIQPLSSLVSPQRSFANSDRIAGNAALQVRSYKQPSSFVSVQHSFTNSDRVSIFAAQRGFASLSASPIRFVFTLGKSIKVSHILRLASRVRSRDSKTRSRFGSCLESELGIRFIPGSKVSVLPGPKY